MKALPIVPNGWYLLNPNDTIQDGDLFHNKYTYGNWNKVNCLAGSKVGEYTDMGSELITTVIRQASLPVSDKEWVNPWD